MKNNVNPWTKNDELEHYPSVMEWWCTEGFFKTIEDDNEWSFKTSFSEWCTGENKNGCIYKTTIFNLTKNKYYDFSIRDDDNKLKTIQTSNGLSVNYNNSFLKGCYPRYLIRCKDKKNKISLDLDFQSEALPHWIAQNVTGGYLPMGFGFYKYGFIPRNKINGTMSIEDKNYKVAGTGYYEHVWGDFSYRSPILNFSSFKKSLSIYSKLIGWWIHNHKPKIPNKIRIFSENNPLGYDWIWAILDNGWSIFFGNILFWLSEGPIFGTLVLTKDGKKYKEFCNVKYKYKNIKHSENFDFYYPTEFEIEAKDTEKNEKLNLTFKSTSKIYEYVSHLKEKKWLAFVICEIPGQVKGTYSNDKDEFLLTGSCKMEPQRQISYKGHNYFTIDFLKPPKGIGLNCELNSHFLEKKIKLGFKLDPLPHINFEFKKT